MQTLELRDKNVVVLGLGKSGLAAAELLARDGARVVVRDEAENGQVAIRAELLRRRGVRVELGRQFDRSARFDLAVLSPGIAPERPIVRDLLTANIPVLSELELAYRYCLCPIVAVTGTNGKTTTTELITDMLACAGQRVMAAGNIGHAFSDAVESSASLDSLVLEVSSFQLEKTEQFRPSVSVLLNVRPDHLDRYSSMEEYATAKSFIFRNQTGGDVAVLSAEAMALMRRMGTPVTERRITFSAFNHTADLWLDWVNSDAIWCRLYECNGIALRMSETNLRGVHNAENIMATLAVGLAMGLPVRVMREAILSYVPQPHRCELVAVKDGVSYINDSKATNPDAVEKALLSQRSPVVLIAGGRGKGLDFSAIKEVVSQKVKLAVLIGETRNELQRVWGDMTPCAQAESMEDAVRLAAEHAVAGDVVLLSPACASFDMFENYEHRGLEFKRQVHALHHA